MTAWVRILAPAVGLCALGWGVVGAPPPSNRDAPGSGLPLDVSQALAAEADTAVRSGRVGDALEALERLHAAYPRNDIYISQLAEAYAVHARPAEAAALWDLYLDRSPVPWEACPAVGDTRWAAGEYVEAVKRYRQCYELEPTNPDHLLALGLAHERLGDFAAASSVFAEGAALDARYLDFRTAQARMVLQAGDPAAALGLANGILEDAPDDTDAVFARGLALERLGREDEAAEAYTQGLRLAPSYAGMSTGLARLRVRSGDAAAARVAAAERVAQAPDDVDALLVLALALEQLGEFEDATETVSSALRLSPRYGDLYLVRGRLAEARGDIEAAVEDYDRLLAMEPERADAEAARLRALRGAP